MGYLDETTNMRGQLTGEARERLIAVLADPNQETWEEAHSLILNGERHVTLWQAVVWVDPSFPKSRPCGSEWERVPDYDTVARAIRYAVTGGTG